MSRLVVGLDIGTTKIACFVGQKNEHGKLEILSFGQAESLGVVRGSVHSLEKTIESIKAAVRQATVSLDGAQEYSIQSVFVGVAGQHIQSRQHRAMITREDRDKLISKDDIEALVADMYKMVMPPGEQIVTVIPKQYAIDDEKDIVDPMGYVGKRFEANFHVISGDVGSCTNIARSVNDAGLTMVDMVLEPMASSEAVLSQDEKDAGVVLVDIGGGTTDVAIFYEGILQHTAIIPFGGNTITEDVKEGCMIMRRDAERLKVKFGSALPSECQANDVVCIPGLRGREQREISVVNLANIINARMQEIMELVDYHITSSGLKRRLIGGVVVTGGGAQLKHLTQLVSYVTGMDARIGYPNEHIANHQERFASPMYATGIGLVLSGFNYYEGRDVPYQVENTIPKKEEVVAEKPEELVAKPTKRFGLFEKLVEGGKRLFIDEE